MKSLGIKMCSVQGKYLCFREVSLECGTVLYSGIRVLFEIYFKSDKWFIKKA